MVMTILEAQVSPDKAVVLVETYGQATKQLEAGIVKTYLAQSAADPGLWRILTVWESREALEAMRRTGAVPTGVAIFRAAGAAPELSIFKIAAEAGAT